MNSGNGHYVSGYLSEWNVEYVDDACIRPCINDARRLPEPQGYYFVDEDPIHWSAYEDSTTLPWSHAARGPRYPVNQATTQTKRHHVGNSEYSSGYGYASPPYQGDSSSIYTMSSGSDRHTPYLDSPELACALYSPDSARNGPLLYDEGFASQLNGHPMHGGGSCVAMQNVQPYDHTDPTDVPYEEGGYMRGAQQPQEGFVPMSQDGESPESPHHHYHPSDAESIEIKKDEVDLSRPVIRKRRPAAQRPSAAENAPVSKRHRVRRGAVNVTKVESDDDTPAPATGAFPCPLSPYGCTSSFGAKNECKRHTFTQHFRMGYWRCDQCSQASKKPNDFNRKDLFVQHVRRMHPVTDAPSAKASRKSRVKVSKDQSVEEALNAAAERCYRKLREPPKTSCCLFCEEQFTGNASFDARMEHIGRHMEYAKREKKALASPKEWQVDESTEVWMLEQSLVVDNGRKIVLADGCD